MSQIRVALVDDHPVVLAGIKALLQAAPEIELVGEATTGAAGLELISTASPDVAVVDISLPDLSGLDLARQLASGSPEVRLLVLTVHEDHAYVQPLLQAGARGYLLKRSAAEDLLRAIRAVAEGELYLDPAITETALGTPAATSSAPDEKEPLSPREAEVIGLVAQGFSNKEIAGKIDVSVKTVETYKARAAEKLGLRTRAEIVRYGARQGWLDGLGSSHPDTDQGPT